MMINEVILILYRAIFHKLTNTRGSDTYASIVHETYLYVTLVIPAIIKAIAIVNTRLGRQLYL